MSFEDVAVAIGQTAFVTSELPVLLSLEYVVVALRTAALRFAMHGLTFCFCGRDRMHCSPDMQFELAKLLVQHVGEALMSVRRPPLDTRHSCFA